VSAFSDLLSIPGNKATSVANVKATLELVCAKIIRITSEIQDKSSCTFMADNKDTAYR